MTARIVLGSLILMFVLAIPAHADGKGELQRYFSNASERVKATSDPFEKRTILNESFQSMSKALDMVKSSPWISKDEGMGIDRYKAILQEKRDELAGVNGFTRVSDVQLNSFSDYVVQDMEQADQMVTISIVTLLLIIILIVLLV